jgi:hypothetical protein
MRTILRKAGQKISRFDAPIFVAERARRILSHFSGCHCCEETVHSDYGFQLADPVDAPENLYSEDIRIRFASILFGFSDGTPPGEPTPRWGPLEMVTELMRGDLEAKGAFVDPGRDVDFAGLIVGRLSSITPKRY